MLITFSMLIAGLALLFAGGQGLVQGASELGRRMSLSPALIGFVLLGLGTSAPELAFGIGAAMTHHGQLAVGNVVGSNIVNICFVLGLAALIAPFSRLAPSALADLPALLAVSLLGVVLVYDGQLTRPEGLILLLAALICILLILRRDRNAAAASSGTETETNDDEAESVAKSGADAPSGVASVGDTNSVAADQLALQQAWWQHPVLWVIAGLVALMLGAELVINGASRLALSLGVPEAVIGLTVTAFGTGVPETAATIIAALRREFELAIANIAGSNIFNLGLVLGTSALVEPLHHADVGIVALAVVLAATFAMIAIAGLWRFGRVAGGMLLGGYLLYTAYAFM